MGPSGWRTGSPGPFTRIPFPINRLLTGNTQHGCMAWIIRSTLLAATIALASNAQAANDVCKDVPVSQLSHDDIKSCDETYKARQRIEEIRVAPTRAEVEAEEARKRRARAAAGDIEPVSIDMCPPPRYVMTERDGCFPRGTGPIILVRATKAAQPAAGVVSPENAVQHAGEAATVCGTVASARYATATRSQPTFLNLDKPYPNPVFTAVIYGEDRSKFGEPETRLQGKRVCVTGTIRRYRGVPEIIMHDPQQLQQ
jgi:hypothetical protein